MAIRTRRRRPGVRRARKAASQATRGLKLAFDLASIAASTLTSMNPALTTPTKKKRSGPAKPRPATKAAAATSARKRLPPSSFRVGQHECDQGARPYKIFKPGSAVVSNKPPPLLVMLHGCAQSPDDFAAGTRMNVLAKEFGLIVVYPAQSAEAHPTRCWNWFQHDQISRDQGEAAIIASLTRRMLELHEADPARVYIAGLSAGASMALAMTTAYPELFAAVGAHSGLPAGAAVDQASAMLAMQRGNPGMRLEQPVPTIIFHGSRDHVVNPRNGRLAALRACQTFQSLRSRDTAGQVPGGRAFTKTVHRIGSGRPLVEHWEIEGSGHGWSGGSAKGRFTDPKGPDASREVVRFFLRHSLSARQRALRLASFTVP